MNLPDCGLYRTHVAIGDIPAGSLVYFHNHGDPGPGIYRPAGWIHNRAQISKQGKTLTDATVSLEFFALPSEGFYRTTAEFHCCEQQCRTYAAETLVQLGYNARGQGILFVPQLTAHGLALPEKGRIIEDDRFSHLAPLKVAMEKQSDQPAPQVH